MMLLQWRDRVVFSPTSISKMSLFGNFYHTYCSPDTSFIQVKSGFVLYLEANGL